MNELLQVARVDFEEALTVLVSAEAVGNVELLQAREGPKLLVAVGREPQLRSSRDGAKTLAQRFQLSVGRHEFV